MKKFIYSLTSVFLLIMLALTGCGGSGGGGWEENSEPSGLVIIREGAANITADGTLITMQPDATLTLTMNVTSGGTASQYLWEIDEADEEFLELTGKDSASVQIKALKETVSDVELTATAANSIGSVSLTIAIKVSGEGTVTPPPPPGTNVLFEWDPSVQTTLTSGGNNPSFTHPNHSQFRTQKDGMVVKSMRPYGANITLNAKGIPLGVASSNARLAIGQYGNVQTQNHTETTNPVPDLDGEIDLYRKRVRLTIDYADASVTTGYILRVYIGNNWTGQANSIFGNSSNLWTANLTGEGTNMNNLLEAYEGNTAEAGKVVLEIDTTKDEGQIGANLFEHENEAYLAKTFIALHAQGTSPNDANITITGIKLEYIDGEDTPDPIELVIKDGDDNTIGETITIDVDEEITLTATPADATFTWATSNNSEVTVSSTSGNTVTIKGIAETQDATITVTAEKNGFFTVTRVITVRVAEPGTPPPSGTIWEWIYSQQVWNNLNANTNGSHAGKNIRAGGQALNNATTNDGVVLLAGGRFIIGGSTTSVPTTSNTVTDTGGQFDFSKFNTKGTKIKISIDYRVIDNTGTQANKNLRIQVNNNTTTNNASVLTNWEVARGVIDAVDFAQEGTLSGIFDPNTAALHENASTMDLELVLSQSLVAITLPSNSGSVLIKSIRIEYVD